MHFATYMMSFAGETALVSTGPNVLFIRKRRAIKYGFENGSSKNPTAREVATVRLMLERLITAQFAV